MVTLFEDHVPVTPEGNPLKVAPVAPVVVYVILVIAVLTQMDCESVPVEELNLIEFNLQQPHLRLKPLDQKMWLLLLQLNTNSLFLEQ